MAPQLKFSCSNIRLSSQRSSLISFMQPVCPPTLYLWLLLLPPTSHGQLTLHPPCLTNSLPLFIQPCFHGDRAESPQTAWTCSLRRSSWPSKSPRFQKIFGTWYGINVPRMKHIKAFQQHYQALFAISLCFWLLSGDQYHGQLCCEIKNSGHQLCLWFTRWAIAKLFA